MDRASRAYRWKAALTVLLGLIFGWARAEAQSARPIEDFWVPNGTVSAIAAGGGRVYVGGSFDGIGPYTGSSVRLDASTAALSLASLTDGVVYSVAPDGAGGWFLAGSFTRVLGSARRNLAHVLADGRLASWAPDTNVGGVVYGLCAADAVVYAGGFFNQIAGQARTNLAALDAATGAPTPWNPAPNNDVYTCTVSGGNLYVGGRFSFIAGVSRGTVAAFNRSTGAILPWNPGGPLTALSITALPTGVYVVGTNGVTSGVVRAIDVPPSSVVRWTQIANGSVRTAAADSSRVYIGGVFTTVTASLNSRDNLAALDATNGSLTAFDPNSGGGTGGVVYTLALQGTTLYAGGDFARLGGADRHNLGAVDTTLDTNNATAWNPLVNARVWNVAAAGAFVYAGGELSSAGGVTRKALAGLDAASGAVLGSWDPNPSAGAASPSVNALALASSGTLYAAGNFNVIGGLSRSRLAAVDAAGAGVGAFDAQSDGSVAALAWSSTSLYVSGQFGNIGGQFRPRLAALDPATGVLRASFNASASGQQVDALAASPGALYVGGGFTAIQGGARLIALDPTTGVRDTLFFTPAVNSQVLALSLQGSTLYAGGVFSTVNSVTRNGVAGLSTANGAVDGLDPRLSGGTPFTRAYAVGAADTSVFVGGTFANAGGQPRANLAALQAAGGDATAWNPGVFGGSSNTEVRALTTQGNVLYVGGDFRSTAGQYRRSFAAFCLVPAPTTLSATSVGPNEIDLVWTATGAPSYEVWRARQAGGPYDLLATVPGTTYVDTAVDGGVTYYYVVRARDGCSSGDSPEASAVATGACSLPPDFDGAAWSRTVTGPTCSLEVGWAPAVCPCGGGVRYSVYRDTSAGFTPSLSNRIASGLSGSSYVDATAQPSTGYYYVVRARSSATGQEDSNLIEQAVLTGACALGPPSRVTALTVRSTDGRNDLQWLNPASGSYGRTRIRYRLDTFPADENDGTLLVEKVGAPGAPDSVPDTGLTDDVTVFYAAFVDNGAGVFSSGRNTSGRPFNTSLTDAKWAFSIGMTAIVPPGNGIGQIHAVGQDNSLHSMVKGTFGGSWPSFWTPQTLTGPSQGRPSTIGLRLPIGGATRAIFLGTQAGTVYALNAETGDVIWSQTVSGPVQAAPSGWFSFFGGSAGMDYVLVGTRDGTLGALNRFYALHLADGSVAWSYDGSADSKKIGVISGQANVDYLNKRVCFASAAFGTGAGERDTVWCLDLETGALLWSAELSDITGSPVIRDDRLYVASYTPGTGGQIHALDASSGASVWGGATFSTPDSEGPVKSFVAADRLSPTGRFLFSTNNVLWALDDPAGSSTPPSVPTWVRDATVDATPIANPSTPGFLAGGPYIWVGSSDGKLYRLDYDTGATLLATPLGDTVVPAAVGGPTIDLRGGFLYVGSLAGIIYAVSLP